MKTFDAPWADFMKETKLQQTNGRDFEVHVYVNPKQVSGSTLFEKDIVTQKRREMLRTNQSLAGSSNEAENRIESRPKIEQNMSSCSWSKLRKSPLAPEIHGSSVLFDIKIQKHLKILPWAWNLFFTEHIFEDILFNSYTWRQILEYHYYWGKKNHNFLSRSMDPQVELMQDHKAEFTKQLEKIQLDAFF